MTFNRYKLLGSLLAVALLVSGPARSTDNKADILSYSAADVVGVCRNPHHEIGGCWMIFTGYHQAHEATAEGWPETRAYCAPNGLHMRELSKTLGDWFDDKGKNQASKVPGYLGFLSAMREAWPCGMGQ